MWKLSPNTDIETWLILKKRTWGHDIITMANLCMYLYLMHICYAQGIKMV